MNALLIPQIVRRHLPNLQLPTDIPGCVDEGARLNKALGATSPPHAPRSCALFHDRRARSTRDVGRDQVVVVGTVSSARGSLLHLLHRSFTDLPARIVMTALTAAVRLAYGWVRAVWVVASRSAFHTVTHERQDLGNHLRRGAVGFIGEALVSVFPAVAVGGHMKASLIVMPRT